MLYEIINPSDAYTIEADDHAVAAVACFLLGQGQYAFEPVDGSSENRVPIFLFGGSDEWCQKTFGKDLQGVFDDVKDTKSADLATCFDSCLIGGAGARDEFTAAAAAISDPAKIAEFKAVRHEKRRSSINDIGRRASQLADHFWAEAQQAAE